MDMDKALFEAGQGKKKKTKRSSILTKSETARLSSLSSIPTNEISSPLAVLNRQQQSSFAPIEPVKAPVFSLPPAPAPAPAPVQVPVQKPVEVKKEITSQPTKTETVKAAEPIPVAKQPAPVTKAPVVGEAMPIPVANKPPTPPVSISKVPGKGNKGKDKDKETESAPKAVEPVKAAEPPKSTTPPPTNPYSSGPKGFDFDDDDDFLR
jgi:hypothetical protein